MNINIRDRRNQTCLHVACSHGNSFVVHTLLRGGAVRFPMRSMNFIDPFSLRIYTFETLMDGLQPLLQRIMADWVVYKC